MTTPRWLFRLVTVTALVLGVGGAAVAVWVGATISSLRAESAATEAATTGVVDVGFALRTALNDAARTPQDAATLSLEQAQARPGLRQCQRRPPSGESAVGRC